MRRGVLVAATGAALALAAIATLATRPGAGRALSPAAVARVDSLEITQADLLHAVEGRVALGASRAAVEAAPDAAAALALLRRDAGEAVVAEALDGLIDRRLAERATANVRVPPGAVDARLAGRRRRLERPGSPTLEQLWARRGGLEALRRELALEAALDELVGAPSEEELARFFAERRDVWSGRRLRLSHVLLPSEETARAARAELDAGAAWEAVCKARSIDEATRGAAGDLGWTRRSGDLPDELAAAAFRIEKGRTSDPVKTRYGWHLVRWTDEQAGRPIVLDDVRVEATEDLARERRIGFVRGLRAAARIEKR